MDERLMGDLLDDIVHEMVYNDYVATTENLEEDYGTLIRNAVKTNVETVRLHLLLRIEAIQQNMKKSQNILLEEKENET